jgi:hypothetical protein
MSLVTTRAFRYPNWFFNGIPSSSSGSILDAAGEYHGVVFQALEDMTINHISWRPNSVTGSPTANITIETVNAAGYSTGTLWAANTCVVTGTLTNAWTMSNLNATATITRGQFFAVKFNYLSGTSFNVQNDASMDASLTGAPYSINQTTGAEVKSRMGREHLALGSSNTSFYYLPQCTVLTSHTQNTWNSTTTTTAQGMRFQLPFRAEFLGVRLFLNAQVGDYNLVCYDDAGNELSNSSTPIDGNYNYEGSGAMMNVFFDNSIILEPNTWYRVAQEATTATNVNLWTINLPDTTSYNGAHPFGANGYYTSRASGVWTDFPNKLVGYDLWLRALDDGRGSSVRDLVVG